MKAKKRKNLKLIQNKRKKEIINWMQKILIESKTIKLKQKKRNESKKWIESKKEGIETKKTF